MVPVSVRGDGEPDELGNRISFMFIELPCDEPDPERRLRRVHTATAEPRGGDPGVGDSTLKLAGSSPRRVQRLVSRLMASPRMFNLVVSNIPGPSEPMYMAGCELKEAYPVVPLAQGHTLSIGMTTIRDRACFGLYADRRGWGCQPGHRRAERSTGELVEVSSAMSGGVLLTGATGFVGMEVLAATWSGATGTSMRWFAQAIPPRPTRGWVPWSRRLRRSGGPPSTAGRR